MTMLRETFFHTLKTELLHHRHYATRAEATRSLGHRLYQRDRDGAKSNLTPSNFSGEDHYDGHLLGLDASALSSQAT